MSAEQAVILSAQKYNDRALVLHTYTQSSGRRNYLLYGAGARGKRATVPPPLTLVELTVSGSTDKGMQTVRDMTVTYVPRRMDEHRRRCVALFIAEVLYRTLRHPMPDEDLFDRVARFICELDTTDTPENMHLSFLAELAHSLGFAIDPEARPDLLRTPVTRAERQQALQAMADYLCEHIDDLRGFASLPVLMAVFD